MYCIVSEVYTIEGVFVGIWGEFGVQPGLLEPQIPDQFQGFRRWYGALHEAINEAKNIGAFIRKGMLGAGSTMITKEDP